MLRAQIHPHYRSIPPSVLFALLTTLITAQNPPSSSSPLESRPLDDPFESSTPLFPSLPPLPSTSDSSLLPSISDNAPPFTTPPSSHDPSGGDDGHNDGLLNYYFLLIAVFIIVIIIVYWSLSKRRKASLVRQQSYQQDALAQDLNRHGWGQTFNRRRWRRGFNSDGGMRLRDQEGLDERGEAPPPYVKEPERAHLESRGDAEGVELGDWEGRNGAKPPDYEERRPG